jgi:hypothetical protein
MATLNLTAALSYALGQCTWGVAQMVSWVPAGWGNAAQWVGNAAKQGHPISSTPVVGSVAVWQAGQGGAGSAGHVAEVIATGVGPNGPTATVREMNFGGNGGGPGRYDTRTLTASQANAAQYILPTGSALGTQGGVASTMAASSAAGAMPTGCMSLADINSGSVAGKLPIIGGPAVLVQWMSQPCVWKRTLIQAGCVALIWWGMKLASVPNPAAPVVTAARTGARDAMAAA